MSNLIDRFTADYADVQFSVRRHPDGFYEFNGTLHGKAEGMAERGHYYVCGDTVQEAIRKGITHMLRETGDKQTETDDMSGWSYQKKQDLADEAELAAEKHFKLPETLEEKS